MRRRRFYLSAPADVVALSEEAEELLDKFLPCKAEQLVGAAGEDRPDLAVMLLYRLCFRGPNGDFLKWLQRLPIGVSALRSRFRLIIVPGLNFQRHPETGADGNLLAAIAGRFGVAAEIADIDPCGSAGANGKKIAGRLDRLDQEPTWLISISKGTADVRAAYNLIGRWPKGIAGWIDLSGVFQGTPIADRFTRPSFLAFCSRLLLALGGLTFDGIEEMRTDSPLWRAAVIPPEPDRLVHVIGFAPSWSIETRIAHHYRWLTDRYGPNDGLTPLSECFTYPGRIFPIWGADHFMRVPDLATLIYKLVHFIDATETNDYSHHLTHRKPASPREHMERVEKSLPASQMASL
jgi:hypothetical protein